MRARTSPRANLMVALGAAALALSFGGAELLAAKRTARSAERPSLIVMPDRDFAASGYVHRLLDPSLARDDRSAIWVAQLRRQISDHGVASVNIHEYSPPLYVVSDSQSTVRVKAVRASEPGWRFEPLQRQWSDVPLPDGLEPSRGTDKEAIVYQPSTGRYWEFWGMERTGGKVTDSTGRATNEWRAAWGWPD